VKSRTAQTLKLQAPTEAFTLELADIAKQETSSLSLMPEGLLEVLDEKKARDLIAYLMSKESPAR
jgi:hypothetical protein